MKSFFHTATLLLACAAAIAGYLREPVCCVEASEPITMLVTGKAEPTGNPFDMHIQGPGFFAILDAFDGSYRYTRHGAFRRDGDGYIVTIEGLPLHPGIHVPDDIVEVLIAQDGLVQGRNEGTIRTLGQVRLFTFENPNALRLDWDKCFRPTLDAGPAREQVPGNGVAGTIRQSFVELPRATLLELPARHDLRPELH